MDNIHCEKKKTNHCILFFAATFAPSHLHKNLAQYLVWVPFFLSLSPFGNFCVFFCMRKDTKLQQQQLLQHLDIYNDFHASLRGPIDGQLPSCPFGRSPCAPLSLTITFSMSFMQGNMLFTVHSINCNVITLGHAHSMIAYPKEYNLNDLFILSLQKFKQDIASRTLRIVRCPNENLQSKENLLIIVCQLIRGRNGFTSQKASQRALA